MNNFQSIRNDLFEEVVNVLTVEQRSVEMAEMAQVLDQQAQQRNIGMPPSAQPSKPDKRRQESTDHIEIPSVHIKWPLLRTTICLSFPTKDSIDTVL